METKSIKEKIFLATHYDNTTMQKFEEMRMT